jgi:hypothetical protein
MAYAHEIKFFVKDSELYAALYDQPPIFCSEFWVKNIKAEELGVRVLPENIQLEQKYKVQDLGIKPFYISNPTFEFMNKLAETAWKEGIKLAIGTLI